uniref:CTCK domain-containing protein n=1 Tax=Anopheles coluzzii TaxID=1518534 RepID=A0A8W7P5U8_ANOCL
LPDRRALPSGPRVWAHNRPQLDRFLPFFLGRKIDTVCVCVCAVARQAEMATVPHVWLALATVILATMHGIPATANREHKVHNIVLYPNKQSWCTTRNISQVITEPGCKQVTIDNNVCVGACFSYSIPHTEPSDPGEIIGPYCDSCQPSDVSYVFVKVDCTESGNAKSPYLYKQVQLIHNCTCTACDEQSTHGTAALVTSDHQPGGGSQEHPASAHDQQLGHDHRHHAKHAAGTTVEAGSEESPSDSDMIQDDIPEILEYLELDQEPGIGSSPDPGLLLI